MRRMPALLTLSLAAVTGFALVACVPPPQPKAVEITAPKDQAFVTSPLRVTGTADVFEGQFQLQLLDAANHVLAQHLVQASCSTGCRGHFDVTLTFVATPGSILHLHAFRASPKDGHLVNLGFVYVRTPAPPTTTTATTTTLAKP